MEKRFYVSKEDFILKNQIKNTPFSPQVDDEILLGEDEHLHLSKVLRCKVGEIVECFFDESDIFSCQILQIDKNSTRLKIVGIFPCKANPKVSITLFQGLPKLDKLELITQKLCELGATKIVPFSSQFTIAKANLGKIDRLGKIVVSACKQCGRTSLLKIENPIKLNQIAPLLKNFDLVLFANERENAKLLTDVLGVNNSYKNIACIVGSEGGFSAEEIDFLVSLGVSSFSMGSRILRTETASISLASNINLLCGN